MSSRNKGHVVHQAIQSFEDLKRLRWRKRAGTWRPLEAAAPVRSVLALLLSAALFVTTLDAQVGTQLQSQSASKPGSAPAAAQRPQSTGSIAIPAAISECDGDQCTRGGGGAIWLFEGTHGQAMWHYTAIANLTVEKFDGHTIVIHREDPNPSYSSPRFADPSKRSDGVFFADYTGTIHGDRIDGTVIWNGGGSGTWYATIPESLCSPFAECPLDVDQVVQLGQNSVRAKLYTAGLECFRVAAAQGNADGEALAGIMLRDGVGTAANPAEALKLLEESAEQDDYNGELGLSQIYEFGIGTQKDPERTAFWKNRAYKRIQELRAQQNQMTLGKYLMGAVALGVILTILGAGASELGSGLESDPTGARQIRAAAEDDWFRRGGGAAGPPDNWTAGDAMPEQ